MRIFDAVQASSYHRSIFSRNSSSKNVTILKIIRPKREIYLS
jgi:hypothetical protein